MFGLGLPELVVILVVALLFLGPDKLPEAARSLGKGLRELRKATDDIRDTVTGTVQDAVREVTTKPSPMPKIPPPPEGAVPSAPPVAAATTTVAAAEPAPAVPPPEPPKPAG